MNLWGGWARRAARKRVKVATKKSPSSSEEGMAVVAMHQHRSRQRMAVVPNEVGWKLNRSAQPIETTPTQFQVKRPPAVSDQSGGLIDLTLLKRRGLEEPFIAKSTPAILNLFQDPGRPGRKIGGRRTGLRVGNSLQITPFVSSAVERPVMAQRCLDFARHERIGLTLRAPRLTRSPVAKTPMARQTRRAPRQARSTAAPPATTAGSPKSA